MKVSRKKYCLAVLFMIATLLFTACNGTDLQTQKLMCHMKMRTLL